jgi:hypothetical protein
MATFGQAVYGSIVGNVTDSTGAVVPRAKVTITDTGKGINYTTTTNESGNYSQTHLILGSYQIRVEAAGFESYVQQNVNVEVDAATQVNARLNVGSVGEVVNVTAEAPLLKTERSDVSDTMTQHEIQAMPAFQRDMSRMYFFVPGVQATGTTARLQPASSRRIFTGLRSAASTGAVSPSCWMEPITGNLSWASRSLRPILTRSRK